MRVRIIQKILNAQQDLLDCNCRLPAFILVENAQAYCPRWEDVGMKERGSKLALGWFAWVFFREDHAKFVDASFPWCLIECKGVKRGGEQRGGGNGGAGEELTFALPGMPTSQFMRSSPPSAAFAGRA